MISSFRDVLTNYPVLIGLLIRLGIAWVFPWLLDDGRYIPGVAYTDIDYHVFTDGAQYVAEGKSPYDRHTYRYTPFLAALLAPYPLALGRYLFCIADTICGWIIIKLRRRKAQEQSNSNKLQDALWWMYNPLAINICTRGSAESLVVLLPVLLTLVIVSSASPSSKNGAGRMWLHAGLAGFMHGVAVHSKLYPIIYSLSFMAYFGVSEQPNFNRSQDNQNRLLNFITLWVERLISPSPLIFLTTFLISAGGLTYLAVLQYGMNALEEGMLYHLSRVDHRHNYSMFWYFIYLARGLVAGTSTTSSSVESFAWLGRLLMVPQLVLLVYTSLGIAPYNLGLALFIQTFVLVAFNKVITAQYFTWYLCLLPLCSQDINWSNPQLQRALLILGISTVSWLGSAYCLEMQGMAVHRIVWLFSVLFFVANVNLLAAILHSTSPIRGSKSAIEKIKKEQ